MTASTATETAQPAPDETAPKPKRSAARRTAMLGLAFVLPSFLLFAVFRFFPAIAGVVLSLFDYDISGTLEWRALENFQTAFADPLFWKSLRITLIYSILAVPISLLCSLVLALGVRRSFRGAGFFRSIFFLPVITSLVLAGTVFKWVFSTGGPISQLSGALGFSPESWLSSSVMVIPAMVLVGVWSRFGYGMLILLAALQEVPRSLEEAAMIDGAGGWSRFRHIVLPHLKPALFFLMVIETTASFQVFDLVYVLTQGGPANGSYTLVYMLYDQGFKYQNYGLAAAIGVCLFILTLIIALIQRYATREK